jgi:hypothetical protein
MIYVGYLPQMWIDGFQDITLPVAGPAPAADSAGTGALPVMQASQLRVFPEHPQDSAGEQAAAPEQDAAKHRFLDRTELDSTEVARFQMPRPRALPRIPFSCPDAIGS